MAKGFPTSNKIPVSLLFYALRNPSSDSGVEVTTSQLGCSKGVLVCHVTSRCTPALYVCVSFTYANYRVNCCVKISCRKKFLSVNTARPLEEGHVRRRA